MSTDPRIEAAADAVGDYNSSDAWPKSAMSQALAALAAFDKAATITTFTGVDSLPDGSVIIDKHGDVSQRRGDAWCSYETAPMPSRQIAKYLPARVIHWGTE